MILLLKFGSKENMFHPKLTNPSPFFYSTKSTSDPKHDINTTEDHITLYLIMFGLISNQHV